jgi:hypothetical protein
MALMSRFWPFMTKERHKRELAEALLEAEKLRNEKVDMLALIRWLQQTRQIKLPVILKRDWQEYRN